MLLWKKYRWKFEKIWKVFPKELEVLVNTPRGATAKTNKKIFQPTTLSQYIGIYTGDMTWMAEKEQRSFHGFDTKGNWFKNILKNTPKFYCVNGIKESNRKEWERFKQKVMSQ